MEAEKGRIMAQANLEEAGKQHMKAELAQKHAHEQAKKMAELAHEQAENAARQAEIMAAKMVQLQNKLEECKKGE